MSVASPVPELTPNPDTVAAALGMLCPVGPLLLVAIDPTRTSGNVIGRTFVMPDELDRATAWAVERNQAGDNTYWTPNEARPMHAKSAKADMVRVRHFWVDCDPNLFRHKVYDAARSALIDETLPRLRQHASFVVDSGNGLQAFWAISDGPSLVSPGETERFEALNERLGKLYGSVGTHNTDRVMRIPGTVNYPSPSKVAKGYPETPRMARLLAADGTDWSMAGIEALIEREEFRARLDETLDRHPTIRERFEGGVQGLSDTSGSARDQSMVTMLALVGWSLPDIRRALERWPHGSVNGRSQGDRYWDRMWANATQMREQRPPAVEIAIEAPKPGGLLMDLSQLRAASQSVRWLIKGLIPADSVGVAFGASGTFKSFIALDCALHMAHGLPWCGLKTQKGGVVYVAGEGGAGLWRRIDAWHRARGLEVPEDFRVCIVPLLLDQQAQIAALHKAIEDLPFVPVLCVVDTQSQTFAGDENSATEVAGYYRNISAALRAPFGMTVIVVTHTGHAVTERPRGSSAILANVDFVFGIRRESEDGMSALVEVRKQKDGDKLPALGFVLERQALGVDEDGDELSSLVASYHDNVAHMVSSAARKRSAQEHAVLSAFGESREIHESILRDALYATMPDAKGSAKRMAWKRTVEALLKSGEIEQTAADSWGKK